MGFSQGVVLGFGVIVSIEEFVGVYPESFIWNEKYKKWIFNENEFELGHEDARIFTSNASPEDGIHPGVFVTSASAVDYAFEKGYVWTPFMKINIDEIIVSESFISDWLLETFPDSTPGFYPAEGRWVRKSLIRVPFVSTLRVETICITALHTPCLIMFLWQE